jgi:hypothetical protein
MDRLALEVLPSHRHRIRPGRVEQDRTLRITLHPDGRPQLLLQGLCQGQQATTHGVVAEALPWGLIHDREV